MKRIAVTFAMFSILAIFSFETFAQNDPNAGYWAIKTEKGMAIFYRNQPQAFSLLIEGKDPTVKENNPKNLTIRTDNIRVEIEFIKTAEFLGQLKLYDDGEVLKAQRYWHIASRERDWKVKLNLFSNAESLIGVNSLVDGFLPNRILTTVCYGYSVEGVPKRAFFQTVLIGDVVLSVGTLFPESVKIAEAEASIKKILESITLLPPQKIVPKKKTKTKPKVARRK